MSAALHDVSLERAYIGELLCGFDASVRRQHLAAPERLSPLDCATVQHGKILAAVHELASTGSEVSPLSVCDAFERAGASNYVEALLELVTKYETRADSLAVMAERLAKLAEARRLRAKLSLALESVESLNLDAAQEHAREALDEQPRSRLQVYSAHDIAVVAASTAYRAAQHGTAVIRSGFGMLDNAYGGMPRGTMLTMGGSTGSGKSSLMLAIAHWLARNGHRPGIVSVEDSDALWGGRVLAHLANLSPQALQSAQLDFEAQGKLEHGVELARSLGICFAFAENRPLADVLTCVRDLLVNHRCDCIFVDYVQAIRLGVGPRRAELVSDAAQSLKGECQQHGVPLVLASQLNRASKDKPYAEPHARDLKETGDLENMSDVVLLLWKTSDEDDAVTLGKIAKVKWNAKRPRFEVVRNEHTGTITNLIAHYPHQQSSNGNGHSEDRRGTWAT